MNYHLDVPANKEARLEMAVQLGRLIGDEKTATASYHELEQIAVIIHAAAFSIVKERYRETGTPLTLNKLYDCAENLAIEAIRNWSTETVQAAIEAARTIDTPEDMQRNIVAATTVFRQKIDQLRKKT